MRNLAVLRNHLNLFRESHWAKYLSVNNRFYHSKQGVYGYVPHNYNVITSPVPDAIAAARHENPNIFRLVEAYRRLGHIRATTDPLGRQKIEQIDELKPSFYGLFHSKHDLLGILYNWKNEASTSEIIEQLDKMYCGNIGIEFMHVESLQEREWIAQEYEKLSALEIDAEEKREIAKSMLISQNFDSFVGSKFPSVKRYGGEGAESCMPFYREIFKLACEEEAHHLFLCMAHRGRLNLLTGMLNLSPELMFSKMRGRSELAPSSRGFGDVLSHLTSVTKLNFGDKSVMVSLLPNPSHLEAANPFTAGRTRAEQQCLKEGDYGTGPLGDRAICLQIHGDAAVSGQGVVQETLSFSQVPHFNVGGSLHLVVNNQVGYTTPAERGRSSRYCSDAAKSIGSPILHVNGEDPEAVVCAARFAWNYRKQFRRDVFVDVICYRRWGHNELDEPTFTNPDMYSAVRSREASIPDAYSNRLVKEGVMEREDIRNLLASDSAKLNKAYQEAETFTPSPTDTFSQVGEAQSKLLTATDDVTVWDTGVDVDLLRWVGSRSVSVPEDFALHPTLKRGHVDARMNKLLAGSNLDWSTAETLALGSLLYQGYDVRICGQDVGRGTFSQRHCMLVDQKNSEMYIPLNDLQCPDGQGHLEVANSTLSEEAVLAFEYGMSIARPDLLCIWEAQFGDFFNGAQIIIDTFITSGEDKWQLQSGLIMLLPHGFDGAGPEHSSCRVERFLQLTNSREDVADSDDINMQVVNPTTPAQMFHLLRRQMLRSYRKPLIIAGPKLLLRFPAAVSSFEDLAPGTAFQPVLDDSTASDPSQIRRLIFTSGKHFYALDAQRQARAVNDVAIIRLEELCPFPALAVQQLTAKYHTAKEFIWCQEEAQNGGAWTFVEPRFRQVVGVHLRYSGRPPLSAPAVGIPAWHKIEAAKLLQDVFP